MKRTLLVTLNLPDTSSLQEYADEILDILQSESIPVLTVLPWGQVSSQVDEGYLGQSPLPIAPEVNQPDAFQSVTTDPWLPGN